MTVSQQPDPTAVGETISYHISRCKHGGYVVWVDGAIYAACTSLGEAVAMMGSVAAEQYGDADGPASPPVPRTASDDPIPRGIAPAPRAVLDGLGDQVRATLSAVLVLLTAAMGV